MPLEAMIPFGESILNEYEDFMNFNLANTPISYLLKDKQGRNHPHWKQISGAIKCSTKVDQMDRPDFRKAR